MLKSAHLIKSILVSAFLKACINVGVLVIFVIIKDTQVCLKIRCFWLASWVLSLRITSGGVNVYSYGRN